MQHSKFYHKLAVFKVEETLFRLDRARFESLSPVFRDMFLMPPCEEDTKSEREGDNDANPIVLEGYKSSDFERLVAVMYPSDGYLLGDPFPITTKEEWISVLKLSTIWDMQKVRAMAIKRLSELLKQTSEVEKIQLGMQYQVPDWLLQGLESIVVAKSSEAYPLHDLAEKLGWEMTAKILWIRGKTQKSVDPSVSFVVDASTMGCSTNGCSSQWGIENLRGVVCPQGHAVVQTRKIKKGSWGSWFGESPRREETITEAKGKVMGSLIKPSDPSIDACKKEIREYFAEHFPAGNA